MVNKIFPLASQAFLDGLISCTGDVLKYVLLRGYIQDDAHQYLSSIEAVKRVAISPALTGKTTLLGVLKANNPTFTAVPAGAECTAVALFKDTGDPATSRLLAFIDNKQRVTVSLDAAAGSTAVRIDPLKNDIKSGMTLNRVSGTGPDTITLTSDYTENGRVLTVTALASALVEGAVYETATGLSVTPNGNDIPVLLDVDGIFSLGGD